MTPKTLRKERRLKFRELITASEIFMQCRLDAESLDAELTELVDALADAAESRTEKRTDETQGKYHTAYNRGEQERPDSVAEFLKMAQSPAVKREREIDDLLSKWAVNFVVNTTSKDWRQFAEYAVDMHTKEGWNPLLFIQWVQSQDGWPNYWSRKRMQENYPKAYAGKMTDAKPVQLDKDGFPVSY